MSCDALTMEHMQNPQKGDEFHELCSFWVIVYDICENGEITVHEAHPPCELPRDAHVRKFPNKYTFAQAYAYQSIPGYWVRFNKTGTYHA